MLVASANRGGGTGRGWGFHLTIFFFVLSQGVTTHMYDLWTSSRFLSLRGFPNVPKRERNH